MGIVSSQYRLFAQLLLWSTTLRTCNAYTMTHVDVSTSQYYNELARRNIILVDDFPLHDLSKRNDPVNATVANTTVISNIPSLNTESGLPVPFDTSLGSNFTGTSCPAYFQKFLTDKTFLSCLPVSLLLQNSASFFQAIKSQALLEKTLDQSCSASLAVCSPLMSQTANDLISENNCQKDYAQQNPLVMQAYAGLKAYEPMYQAACLKNESTAEYCFVEAMETDNASDSYPYYTAIGMTLPAGSKPTCSTCLKKSMQIFAGYAAQKDQPLSNTYLDCAAQVNAECGADFATTQLKSVSKTTSNNASKVLGIDWSLTVSILLITSIFL